MLLKIRTKFAKSFFTLRRPIHYVFIYAQNLAYNKNACFIAQRTFDKNKAAETGDIFLNFRILRFKL